MIKKAVLNQVYLFEWNSPSSVSGTPSLEVKTPSTTYTYSMTQGRSSATVSAISNDRRTLTVDVQVTGLQDNQGQAFLITEGDQIFNVHIVRVEDTTAILAEPLPRNIDLSAPAILEFSLWYYSIPTDITDTKGTYAYTISYDEDLGAQTRERLAKGYIKVTPRPFNTNLDHDDFVAMFPQFADAVPRRQRDFRVQIDRAQDELILMIRDALLHQSLTEDEVFNAQSFSQCHAYFTASLVLEGQNRFEEAGVMRTRAIELCNLAMRSVALDLDGDGLIDDGELDQRVSGVKSDFRANFANRQPTAYEQTFVIKRGMRF
jgi:hypothetical protein